MNRWMNGKKIHNYYYLKKISSDNLGENWSSPYYQKSLIRIYTYYLHRRSVLSVIQSFYNPRLSLYHRWSCWLTQCERHCQQNGISEERQVCSRLELIFANAKSIIFGSQDFHYCISRTYSFFYATQWASVYLSARMIPLAFSFCCLSVRLSYWWAHQLDVVERQSILLPPSLTHLSFSLLHPHNHGF